MRRYIMKMCEETEQAEALSNKGSKCKGFGAVNSLIFLKSRSYASITGL
jgi:hypothetical protein